MAYKQLKLWFDKDLAILLSDKIIKVYPKFPSQEFISSIDKKVDSLELKDRVETIADELHEKLGENYNKGLKILSKIIGPENKEETGMFKKFYWIMPIAKFVEKYGLNDFEVSMKAIEEITKRNTGEYTIRPFLEQFPKETLVQMKAWSKSKNKHVRRLASEGVRPRLPWATKLDQFIENPTPFFPILNNLKDDPSKYVQKSVANCINDVFKDNPTLGKELINKWAVGKISQQRKWIIKHALRNLIKVNDRWAISICSK